MRCCGAVDFTDYAKLGLVVPTTCYTIEKNYINAPVSVIVKLYIQTKRSFDDLKTN